jgi:hypothetical protein
VSNIRPLYCGFQRLIFGSVVLFLASGIEPSQGTRGELSSSSYPLPCFAAVGAIVAGCAVGGAAPFARFERVNSFLTPFTGLPPRLLYLLLKLALAIYKNYSFTFCPLVKECGLFFWCARLTLAHKGLGLRSELEQSASFANAPPPTAQACRNSPLDPPSGQACKVRASHAIYVSQPEPKFLIAMRFIMKCAV